MEDEEGRFVCGELFEPLPALDDFAFVGVAPDFTGVGDFVGVGTLVTVGTLVGVGTFVGVGVTVG